jgi:hypothetical protein
MEQITVIKIGGNVIDNEAVLDAFLDAVYAQSVQDASEAGDLRVVYTPLCGTGLECVGRILEKIGVNDVHVVRTEALARISGAYGELPPLFLFGHSMGSFVVRAYLARHAYGLKGAII